MIYTQIDVYSTLIDMLDLSCLATETFISYQKVWIVQGLRVAKVRSLVFVFL